MTTVGWGMMIVSMGFVVSLALFCFYRVLTAPRTNDNLRDESDRMTR